MKKQNPHIVVIGGGTGSFTLLSGLKKYTHNISALVNMADDGGSTGVLRDQFGVLPPGDVRQCLVALSQSSDTLRELFNYRYPKNTDFAGHSFGNLFLSTVELMSKNFDEAVRLASEILQITGQVIPVTLKTCNLVLETSAGRVVGEYKISSLKLDASHEPPRLALQPKVHINPVAEAAIATADIIVIAPGNLYGSLAPALLVGGMYHALKKAKAPVVYVCNLVNKPHQTAGFAVHDYVRELHRLVGGQVIDTVICNTVRPSKEVLRAYALEGEHPVLVDMDTLQAQVRRVVPVALLARDLPKRNSNDRFILRSLIRHDSDLVAQAIMGLT